MNNQVRLVILFSEKCAYRIAPARGLVFFGALSTSSLGHATRGYQPVPPCGLHEVFLGRLVAWCAWEPDATQPITYMRDRRTVKMAYRDLFFFCSGFSFVGVSRRLGYHPPGGLWCWGANTWYLRRHQCRRTRLRIPVFVFRSAGCAVWLEPLCRSLSSSTVSRTGQI